MTIQELINQLNTVQDKTKKIVFYCNREYGTIESGDIVELKDATEYQDYIAMTY